MKGVFSNNPPGGGIVNISDTQSTLFMDDPYLENETFARI